MPGEIWPALPYEAWRDTAETLHLWTQIVGKVRLAFTPWLNHSWHVTLYVTARGLTTSPIAHGARSFELEFDFIAHRLLLTTSEGTVDTVPLRPMPVGAFYQSVMQLLDRRGLSVTIDPIACELPGTIRLDQDRSHDSYDPDFANRFWRVLLAADRVFKQFRTGFVGKASPVHLFWGGLDLAVTRFSGRRAPPHPGGIPHLADAVTREAYSHEVSSAGFWPGNARTPQPAFYAYAYPEPPGFRDAPVEPAQATYDAALGEFLLPYDVVRLSADPERTLLSFLQRTYEAAATHGAWDRAALECPLGLPRVPRPV
jgi:hypothetical protein